MNDTINSIFFRRVQLQREMAALNKQVNALKKEKGELEAKISAFLKDTKMDAIKMHGHGASIETKNGIKIEDWEQVWNYVIENRATHLLYKKLIQASLDEMVELGEDLPGAEFYTYEKLKVYKA